MERERHIIVDYETQDVQIHRCIRDGKRSLEVAIEVLRQIHEDASVKKRNDADIEENSCCACAS
jgi:hypothetical protein